MASSAVHAEMVATIQWAVSSAAVRRGVFVQFHAGQFVCILGDPCVPERLLDIAIVFSRFLFEREYGRSVDPQVSTRTISQYFAIRAGLGRCGLHFPGETPRETKCFPRNLNPD